MNIPYHWTRILNPELKTLDTVPLTGAAPLFPWEQLSIRLAKLFEREPFVIKPGETTWRSKDDLYEGLGDDLYPLNFSIPSLRGSACWVMPEQDMAILESILLTKEEQPLNFQDRTLSESFYRFLTVETLFQLSQTDFDKSVIPILLNHHQLPQEDALCIDIGLLILDQTVWGRLIVSNELRQSWIEHFADRHHQFLLENSLQKLDIFLHIEAGHVHLSLKELQAVQVGDFILLDHCTLKDNDFSGRVMLTIHGHPVFRAKLKDGHIKILEFPLYHEVETPMAKQEDEDDFSDFDDLIEDDTELEDQTLTDTSFDEAKETETSSQKEAQTLPKPQKESLIPLDQIPVSIVVEVGRIQMPLQKALELEPGNLLELDLHPEDGVDLVVNGKKMGRAELIRIGDAIGVRILEIGRSST